MNPRLDADALMALLPAFYRERDAAAGGPLRALLDVLARQGALVDADVDRLYDNWFIETCDDWVVPYLGDLLGVRALYPVGAAFSPRALVANTLRLRRRKGTALVLEELAANATGWRSRLLSRMNNPSHSTAPRISALPDNECAPPVSAEWRIISQTPKPAAAMAASVALAGRSPSSTMAIAAETSGRVPRMMPPSTADARCRPAISNVV